MGMLDFIFDPVFQRLAVKPIRVQLLLSYVCLAGVSFVVALGISVWSIASLSAAVQNESEASLRSQITKNSGFILQEASDLFEATIDMGVRTLALPAALAVHDATRARYSVAPPNVSYPDSNSSSLKPPLTYDARYPCLASEPQGLQALRGCRNGLKAISAGASSVYIYGLRLDGANAQEQMTKAAGSVSRTAILDIYVRRAWELTAFWTGAYVAVQQDGVYRQFPGFVGNLTEADGFRTYDFRERPWYTTLAAQQQGSTRTVMTSAAMRSYYREYTAPYWSLDGNGFLVSMTVPVHDSSGDFMGVAGTDVSIDALSDIVGQVKLRQTGSVHLYHIASGAVAASPSWDPDPTVEEVPRPHSSLNVAGAGTPTLAAGEPACPSDSEEEGYVFLRRATLEGKYCLVAAVPVEEVIAPIASQREGIVQVSRQWIAGTLIVVLGVFFGLVLPCTVLISLQISGPLAAMSRDTETIVQNIGGDLFRGLDIRQRRGGVGEARLLRNQFMSMLERLQKKRSQARVPARNGAFKAGVADTVGVGADADAALGRPDLAQASPTEADVEARAPEAPLLCNRIQSRLLLQVACPVQLALLVIVIVIGAQMSTKAKEWIEPVKDMMVEEELQSMKVRSFERAQVMREIFRGYARTVEMVKEYTEDLYSGRVDARAAYSSHFSPCGENPSGVSCATPLLEDDTKFVDNSGNVVRAVNYDASVWYAPGSSTAPGSQKAPATTALAPMAASVAAEHQGRATHLDNVARVAYFASHVTDVFWGFERFEAYRQYPYSELGSWA